MHAYLPVSDLEILEAQGRVLVRLSWETAERWQQWFRRHDVESILCLDPVNHEAHLEPSVGLSIDHLRKLLAEIPTPTS
jgi:hypothetical protein